MSNLKARVQADVIAAMKGKDKPRLGVLRLVMADIKRVEVDTQTTLNDSECLAVLTKMVKQRQDAAQQYQAAERLDLAAQEQYEIEVLSRYLPTPLAEDEIVALIEQHIKTQNANSMRDMGAVMATLRPVLQGRADMAWVSNALKRMLSAAPSA